MQTHGLVISVLWAALMSGCSPKPAAPNNSGAADVRIYNVRGIVRGVDAAALSLTVEHEDVPGFMPAMTMPFVVRDPAELSVARIGEGIGFRFFVTEDRSWIANLQPMASGDIRLPSATPGVAPAGGRRLKEGDRVPDFQLIDLRGQPLTQQHLAGRVTLITFIFTRCPVPEFCPLLSRQFGVIEQQIADDPALAGRVGLLSISFDPQDTPELLGDYAARFVRDPAVWRFATGNPAEISKLTHAFSVHVKPEGGTLNHGLCTALVDARGVVVKLWRGNGWKPDEVLEALRVLPPSPEAGS